MFQALIAGTLMGILAGLIPGIHSNTFAAMILVFQVPLAAYFSSEELIVVLISSAVAYTIADIIPTTLIGVPDEETAIGVLPSHRMVLEGKSFEAISISAASSFLSLIISIPLFLTVLYAGVQYEFVKAISPAVLLATFAYIILSERGDEFEGSLSGWRKRFYAFLVFVSSGFIGFVALENSKLAEINFASSVLLPLLSGLFAAPLLLQSFSSEIPEQEKQLGIPDFRSVLNGSLAGFFVSLFPGISSGVATAIAAARSEDGKNFISAMSAANTSNTLLCFAFLISAGKARSGVADAISKIGHTPTAFDAIIISFFTGLVAFLITLAIAKLLIDRFQKINTGLLSKIIFLYLTFLIFLLTGYFGLAVFLTAIPIGLATTFLGVRRINCMGCLIMPILLR